VSRRSSSATRSCRSIIAILGIDELSDEDKITVPARPQGRALPLAAIYVAEQFTVTPVFPYVPIEETVRGSSELIEASTTSCQSAPFPSSKGTIDQVVEDAQKDHYGAHEVRL